ncbi:AraC family transcriptional regulator [Ligilactobacillus agilis]|uniref:AraC family transcriptional regulator n=1 Tax=Ligilactobacillus agilis TaxID=1601 RepID=UPI0022E4C158|nr:helix-turn-helix domain-containing protein [Ligilactobacillus agilis]
MSNDLQHETVLVTPPLPVWLFYHHNNSANHIAAHWHQAIEFSFTLAGSIDRFKIGNQVYQTKPGQILVVNSQVIHSIDVTNHSDNQALSLSVPFNYLESFYPKLSESYFELNRPEKFTAQQQSAYRKLQGFFYQLAGRYQDHDELKFIDIQLIISQILKLLLTHFTEPLANVTNLSHQTSYTLSRLHEITKFVNENYQTDIGLVEIATHCNISRVYLARFFKQHMELTVGQYLNNVRAQHAYKELLTTKKTLSQLALTNGFSGIRTMNRAFTNLYGQTASKLYRERKSAND